MLTERTVGIVGSRVFEDYEFFDSIVRTKVQPDDLIVSGGARGVDSFAQRWAKEHGHSILIHYPDYSRKGSGATFARNRRIVEDSDLILAFYAKGRFQQGGTANTAKWARELNVPLEEYEEPND